MTQHHPAHFGFFPPVLRVALHAQHILRLPGFQHKRAGTRFVGGKPAVAPVVIHRVLLHRFAVEHAEVAERAEGVDHQLRIVRLRQNNLHRVGIGGADLAVDVLLRKSIRLPHRGLGKVEVQQTAHRPDHILRRERVARVEFNVVTQVKGQGFTVRRDIPGRRQRGPDVGERVRVQLHQRVVEIDHNADHFVTGHCRRIEGQQVIHVHADDELVGRRFRVRRTAPHHQREREQARPG
ncbi:Uncharacterised protein [Enterobacter hormaechei]|nr:Uncharacterised protein [Enterobacter hormaechei]